MKDSAGFQLKHLVNFTQDAAEKFMLTFKLQKLSFFWVMNGLTLIYVTGSGILGLMEVHGRNLDFYII